MKRDMINISLPRYGTRMLQAGDSFECNRREARILHALKKARYAVGEDAASAVEARSTEQDPTTNGQTPLGTGGAVAEPPATNDVAALRAEYQSKIGRRPFHGWGAADLRQKIAAGGTGEG